jgi:hypothetical protein
MSILKYSLNETSVGLPKVFVTSIEISESEKVSADILDPHAGRRSANVGSSGAINLKPMKVEISLCLKQKNPIQFATSKILSSLKLAVVQVTDSQVKSKINQEPLTYLPINSTARNESGMEVHYYSVQNLISDSVTFDRTAGSFGQRDAFADSNLKKIPFSDETNLDSGKLYNVPLNVTLMIPAERGGSSIDNLAYYFYLFVESSEQRENSYLISRPSFNGTLADKKSKMGPITSENVIVEGYPQTNVHLFRDNKNQIWCGDVHQMENGNWMSGKVHTGASKPLTKTKLPNIKLKDHRIFNILSKATIQTQTTTDLISVRQRLRSEQTKDGMRNQFVKKVPTTSEVYLSRDKENNCRFFFSVDIEQILKQNSNYPAIIDSLRNTNKSDYYALIRNALIEELTITRRRVIKQEVLTDRVDRVVYSSTDQEAVVVTSNDSPRSKGLKPNLSFDRTAKGGVGNRKAKKTGSILEVRPFVSSKTASLRHFTGTDFEVSSDSSGLYEYTVKIVVKDPIESYIKNKVERIDEIIGKDGSGLSLSQYYLDSTRSRSNYDKFLNRFDDSFMALFEKRYTTNGSNFLFNVISEFVGIVYSITNQANVNKLTMVDAANYLINIASPNTGSPEGIEKVIQLMEGFNNVLKMALNTNKNYVKSRNTNSEVTNTNTNIGGSTRQRKYTVEKVFNTKFDSSTPKTVGFDYLYTKSSAKEPNKDGLAVLNRASIDKRFELETQKYFNSDSPKVEIRNARGDVLNGGDSVDYSKFSFLSPSNIFLETNNLQNTFESLKSAYVSSNRKEMNDLANQIIIYNKSKSLLYSKASDSNERQNIMASSIENILSDRGVSLENPVARASKRSAKVNVFNQESRSRNIDDNDNLFNEIVDNSRDKIGLSGDLLQSILQISETDFLQESNSARTYYFNDDDDAQKLKKQLTNSKLNGRTPAGTIRNTESPFNNSPNQLKALMLSLQNSTEVKPNKAFDQPEGLESVDVFKNPDNYGFLWFNYKSVKMIEVLVGFDSKGSAPLVNSPIWTKLDERHLNSPRNKTLICRLVSYEDGMSGLRSNKNLELPVFNEVFAINLAGSRNTRGTNNAVPFVSFTDKDIDRSVSRNKFTEATKQMESLYDKRQRFVETSVSARSDLVRSELVFSNLLYNNQEVYYSNSEVRNSINKAEMQIREDAKLSFAQLRSELKQRGLEHFLPKSLREKIPLTTSITGNSSGRSGGTGGGTSGGGSTY